MDGHCASIARGDPAIAGRVLLVMRRVPKHVEESSEKMDEMAIRAGRAEL